MKIVITGVAGLLGSRLADWIIENTDNEVIGIDDTDLYTVIDADLLCWQAIGFSSEDKDLLMQCICA